MLLTVLRNRFSVNSTQGRLLINGASECFTLEPRKERMLGKPFCIPQGVYHYFIGKSVHFGRDVIRIDNVEGFSAIEIHPGNFPKDTHGCTLVGTTESADFVGHSEMEFEALLGKILPVGMIEYRSE